MKTFAFQAVACALAAVLLSTAEGCRRDPVKAPYAGRADLLPAAGIPQILVEGALQEHLRFSPPIVENVAGAPLRVSVPMRSVYDDYALNIQYRFEFLDEKGRPLRAGGAEHLVFRALAPRTPVTLEANALDTTATDWRLHVRSAR